MRSEHIAVFTIFFYPIVCLVVLQTSREPCSSVPTECLHCIAGGDSGAGLPGKDGAKAGVSLCPGTVLRCDTLVPLM